jgi:hypothetical protein
MDRSVSSIRMLIDIERSEWKDFRKELCKEDKQRFDGLFSAPNYIIMRHPIHLI